MCWELIAISNFPKIRMRVNIFGTEKCNVTFGLEYTFTPSILLPADILISILLYLVYCIVVLCGSPKKQPRTSSIVKFIFFFWSFEISRNILRNQKILYV